MVCGAVVAGGGGVVGWGLCRWGVRLGVGWWVWGEGVWAWEAGQCWGCHWLGGVGGGLVVQ